jgi:two-component system LytT family response regulator
MMQALIVDQDFDSRKQIHDLVSQAFEDCVIHENDNGLAAVSSVHEHGPDILICEVEAQGLDAFSLLEGLPDQIRPATILISKTSYFAARAFEVGVIDYILKPLKDQRFLQAFERVKIQISKSNDHSQKSFRKLSIRSGRSIIMVEPDELNWVDAEGKYVRLHLKKEVLVLKMSISALEQELDPARFVRIHRSTIVNMDRVRQIQPWRNRRTYQVTLHDGTRLVLSRGMKHRTELAK